MHAVITENLFSNLLGVAIPRVQNSLMPLTNCWVQTSPQLPSMVFNLKPHIKQVWVEGKEFNTCRYQCCLWGNVTSLIKRSKQSCLQIHRIRLWVLLHNDNIDGEVIIEFTFDFFLQSAHAFPYYLRSANFELITL